MPKKPAREHLPGNDGRWFLELVGVVEPALESTDTYATLEGLVPPPAPDDTSTLSAAAVAAAVNGGLQTESGPNGELAPPGEGAPLSSERARRRWPWLVSAALIAVLAAVGAYGAYAFPRSVAAQADELAAQYRVMLTNLRNELPATQLALATLTDTATSDDDVAEVPTAIARLNTASGLTTSQATIPLPETLPLVSAGPYEALQPTRTTMTILGATGRGLAARLGVGYTYRTTMESLFAVNALPTSASDTAITQMSLALATDLADTGRLVAELPPAAGFVVLRDSAVAASQRYATWQIEYLEALRSGDSARASELIAERGAALAALSEILGDAMIAMRLELDPVIVELAREIEATIGQIPA